MGHICQRVMPKSFLNIYIRQKTVSKKDAELLWSACFHVEINCIQAEINCLAQKTTKTSTNCRCV